MRAGDAPPRGAYKRDKNVRCIPEPAGAVRLDLPFLPRAGLRAGVRGPLTQRAPLSPLVRKPVPAVNRRDQFLHALFPVLALQGTPWIAVWEEKERRENVVLWRYALLVASVAYVAHYYLLDVPMGLEPAEVWFRYRMGMAALMFGFFLLYCIPAFYRSSMYRLPVYVAAWALAYAQARSTLWYEDTLYLYAFAFVVLGAVSLRASVLKSLLFAAFVLATQWPSLTQTDISQNLLASAAAVSLIFIYILRSKYKQEIDHFLAVQQNLQAQKQVIELTIDFSDRIRALLPSEISRRLNHHLSREGLTVLQAMDEVLRPRKKQVACLYSDIRGFTQGTKNLDTFVRHGVIPNVKQCTVAIESSHGIPRKVGDLIFAYFDDENIYVNILRSLKAGMDIVSINEAFNRTNPQRVEIRRHVLISSGEAIVGNIGGFDSSLEITALGSPVNLLSRVDELTKVEPLKNRVQDATLLLCSHTARRIRELQLGLRMEALCLPELGMKIRDFEEEENLWLMLATPENQTALEGAIDYIGRTYHERTTPN
jgi:class 3 adenylate cyclase